MGDHRPSSSKFRGQQEALTWQSLEGSQAVHIRTTHSQQSQKSHCELGKGGGRSPTLVLLNPPLLSVLQDPWSNWSTSANSQMTTEQGAE